MRVAVYYNNKDVRIEERPVPKIGPGELLVKVMASGICGSDVLEWYRIKKAPLVLGHEIAGDITETGEGVQKYKKGQRVFVSHHIPCNTCKYCLSGHHTACHTLHTTNYDPGGFSEYLRVPALNVDRGVFVLPDELSYDDGVFIEPLACVVRGQRIAGVKKGDSVLILGGGISGLLHLQLAKALGAAKVIVTDIDPWRLDYAKRLGADCVISAKEDVPAKVKQCNNCNLADVVIICTGAMKAFYQALESVDKGGKVQCFAAPLPGENLSIPVNEFWRNEITLMTSYGNAPYDAVEAIELIKSGRVPVKELITHKLKLDETAMGFKLVAEAAKSMKVIIEPNRK
ncbi:MAG: zinc-dependent dehydrogenase [Elusimicrobiota bacterium]